MTPNGTPVEIPSLDALASDLSKVDALTPEVLKALWTDVCNLEKALVLRMLTGPRPEQQRETAGKTPLLSAAEVAARLNTPKSFVYESARQGRLKSIPLGKKYVRFSAKAVEDFLENGGA